MTTVYIGVGSNIGNREQFINKALWFLRESEDIKIADVSSLYETEPYGGSPQGRYLNGVIAIETGRAPMDLLHLLKDIERKLGRQPSPVKYAPREIDLDILLYGNSIVSTDELIIPHPLMHERIFVLEPLCEIAKDARHPVFNRSCEQLLLIFRAKESLGGNN